MKQEYTTKDLPMVDSLLVFSERFNTHLKTNRMHAYPRYKLWNDNLFKDFQDDNKLFSDFVFTNTKYINALPSLILPVSNDWSAFTDKDHFKKPDSYGYQCLGWILESLNQTQYLGTNFLFLPVSEKLSTVIYLG